MEEPHTSDRPASARELEHAAAARDAPGPAPVLPRSEVLRMLARRGFDVALERPQLPFPHELDERVEERLAALLRHYAFRLFLRGAIARAENFAPGEATRYLTDAQATAHAEGLVGLGLAERLAGGRYRLVHRPPSFGGTLEWYVARELRRRLGFDVAVRVKFGAPDVGGDLDVAATAEGRLFYLELKSSPPKHLAQAEVRAFLARVRALRPDVAVFVMDTSLRLSDKVIPMFEAELQPGAARRVVRETFAITPHVFATNAKPDLFANIHRTLAEGLLALGPPPP